MECLPILQSVGFLDVSDYYRIFSTSKSTWKLFDWDDLDEVARISLRTKHNKELMYEYAFSYFRILYENSASHIFELREALMCYIMRLILLSIGIPRSICYYCKQRDDNEVFLTFFHTWNDYEVDLFIKYNSYFKTENVFSICCACMKKYKFVTITSFCNFHSLRKYFKTIFFKRINKKNSDCIVRDQKGVMYAPLKLLNHHLTRIPLDLVLCKLNWL
jgi:hypothetical protein